MFEAIKNLFKKNGNTLPEDIQSPTIEEPPIIKEPQEIKIVHQTKSLFISAGHSEVDPGASREYDGRIWTEADIVLEFRDMVANHLKEMGVEFAKDGDEGINLPLTEAIKIAKTHDVSVEFHCNAFNTGHANGVETLSSNRNMELGGKLCQAVEASMGARNRGAKGESSGQHSRLGFISQADGIILELFFITSPKDFTSYGENKEAVAKSVAEVLFSEVASVEVVYE